MLQTEEVLFSCAQGMTSKLSELKLHSFDPDLLTGFNAVTVGKIVPSRDIRI